MLALVLAIILGSRNHERTGGWPEDVKVIPGMLFWAAGGIYMHLLGSSTRLADALTLRVVAVILLSGLVFSWWLALVSYQHSWVHRRSQSLWYTIALSALEAAMLLSFYLMAVKAADGLPAFVLYVGGLIGLILAPLHVRWIEKSYALVGE